MRILTLLSELCPSYEYSDVVSMYFTAKLIIAYSGNRNYGDTIQNSTSLRTSLYIYRDIVSPSLTNERINIWCMLCSELSTSGLDLDYTTFFSITTPNLVCDWSELMRCFPANDTGRLLVALCLILRDLPDDSLFMPNEYLQRHYQASRTLYHRIGMDYETYTQCWKSVHLTDLSSSQHYPAQPIAAAARLYHSLQLPMTDLLHDYAALYSEENNTETKIATRGGRKQSRTSVQCEGGKTATDLELANVLKEIAGEPATDVVRGLFYSPARNDAGFECTYLLHHFYSIVDSADCVLIVNPSPDMILYIMQNILICNRLSFLVLDHTLERIYTKQFNCKIFYSIKQIIDQPQTYNRILITARDCPIELIMESLHLASSESSITALIPEVALKKVHTKLTEAGCSIRSVVSIPSKATQSSPRKKVLLEANSWWRVDYFLLQRGLCDKYHTLFGVAKRCFHITYEWIQTKISIADMMKSGLRQSTTGHTQAAKIVRYTPEIEFRLSIQHNCKNRVAGRVYYCSILRPSNKHRKQGKRLTPILEKGLRQRTEAEVLDAVEYAVLDDRFAAEVVRDVLDYYACRLNELSLKSIWYCLRGRLRTKYSYNEDIALELFSQSSSEFSSLVVSTSLPGNYDDAMCRLFPGKNIIPYKYWNQLNLILSTAKEEGYINYNPVAEHMATISARLTKRQQDIRNALTKKTFETSEAQKMLKQFFLPVNIQNTWASDPINISLPIAMLAVPNLREAAALHWGDLVQNASLDTYHLQLTHYLSDDGTLRPLFDRSPDLHRCVPLAPVLSRLLLDYKEWLMDTYQLSETELAPYPIILESYSILGKRIEKVKSYSLTAIYRTIRKYINELGIPANIIVYPDATTGTYVDLNQYGGNILYTNLKYHLRHTCKFTEGELCYYLGLKAPDTYSAHYCAYDHPILLHRMACKLNRWACELNSANDISIAPVYCARTIQEDEMLLFPSTPSCLIHVNMTLISEKTESTDTIALDITSKHGATGTIAAFGRREDTTND